MVEVKLRAREIERAMEGRGKGRATGPVFKPDYANGVVVWETDG